MREFLGDHQDWQRSSPYGELLKERRVAVLGTALDDEAAGALTAQLLMLERAAPGRELSVYINSPGGPFPAFAAVHDVLRGLDCAVATVCIGRAEGTAAVLLAAGTPGRRSVRPEASVVLREPSYARADVLRQAEVESLAVRVERERERTEELLAEYSGRPVERVRTEMERALPLSAAEAVEYGLADRVARRRD